MRLKPDTIALLRLLDHEDGAVPARLTDAPKFMFDFNLVSRLPSGALQLTKTGARALFQAACIDALEHARDGALSAAAIDNDVQRWLISSGFLHAGEHIITARGKLWLASLTPVDGDATIDAQPADAA